MSTVRKLKDFRKKPVYDSQKCNEKCPTAWPIGGADYCGWCLQFRSAYDLPFYPPVRALPNTWDKDWAVTAPEVAKPVVKPSPSQTLQAQQLRFEDVL